MVRNYKYKLIGQHTANTYRFFEVPETKGKYTYIIDIDIMLLEDIVLHYLINWPKNQVPYNNMVRPGTARLTGIQFVKTNDYFTERYITHQRYWYKFAPKEANDAMILYALCDKVHNLPDNLNYRPVFGIHFSPNRGPLHSDSLVTYKEYDYKFKITSEKYPEFFKFKIFSALLDSLKTEFRIRETPKSGPSCPNYGVRN